MLYMRLKLNFISRILELMGNTCVWTKISLKKLIAHGFYLQFYVELQPNDLITMSMRLEVKSHKKNSNLIDDPCN